MRQEDAPAEAPRRALPATLLLLLFAALPVAADEAQRSVADLLRDLRSPIASVRRATESEVAARGVVARETVRTWTREDDAGLRASAWRILGRIGDETDFAAARAALTDEQPAVAEAAAGAIVDLAARCKAPGAPPLPEGSLTPSTARNLALPLARALDAAPAGAPPDCLFGLGEGVVPCLRIICEHPRFSVSEQRRAIEALARIGGVEARRIVSSLAAYQAASGSRIASGEARARRLPRGWWTAINEVGCGPGLEDAHDLVTDIAFETTSQGRVWRIRGIGWRDQVQYYRFVASCPPAEGAETVRELLQAQVELAARRRHMFPSTLVEIARAYLVVSDPTDDDLDTLVRASIPRNPTRRRVEELGGILAMLANFKEREGVKRGIEHALREDRDDMPNTVEAWALYLQGKTDVAVLRERASKLITGDGTVAQRRLGARLWNQLGDPPVELIRPLFTELDPWMRITALGWAIRASEAGRMPAEEVAAALARGVEDADSSVMLYVAASRRVEVPPTIRERILDIAVKGNRGLRRRAWKALETLVVRDHDSGDPGFQRPPVGAALDARIRAAAAFRAETAD